MKGFVYIIVIGGWAKLAYERREDAENYIEKSRAASEREGLAIHMRIARFLPLK